MSGDIKTIFSIYSPINGFLKVIDTPSGRELRSDKNIIVTLSEKHKYFNQRYWGLYVRELEKLIPQFKRALCLGLGGGSIQNELFRIYPGIEILTIEIDPLMNDIHKYYFSGDKNENHKILNLDAKVFLKNFHRFGNYENHFDLIFVDVFSAMDLKEFDKVRNFYLDAKKLLTPNGIYSMNLIVREDEQFEKSRKNLELLSEAFKEVKLVYTSDFFGKANLEVYAYDKI